METYIEVSVKMTTTEADIQTSVDTLLANYNTKYSKYTHTMNRGTSNQTFADFIASFKDLIDQRKVIVARVRALREAADPTIIQGDYDIINSMPFAFQESMDNAFLRINGTLNT